MPEDSSSREFAVASKAIPLSDTELEAYEAQRDLGAGLLQAIREMKTGQQAYVGHEYMPNLRY